MTEKRRRQPAGQTALRRGEQTGGWRRGAWTRYLVALAVVVVGFALAHGPTISKTYHKRYWEDGLFIKVAHEYVESFPDCFTVPSLHAGLYRPLTTHCYYYLTMKAWGLEYEHLKLISMAVFLANAFLFFLICSRIMPWTWALIPIALVVTRHADYDLVSLTVEYQSLLSVFFCLLAFYAFMRAHTGRAPVWEAASYIFFVLAMFSKETAVAMAGAVLVYGLLFDDRRRYRLYVVHALLAVAFAALLFAVFRGMRDFEPTGFLYTYRPLEVARNYIGHAAGFFNFLLPDMDKEGVRFGGRILSLATNPALQAFFFLAVAGEVVLLTRYRSVAERYPAVRRVVLAAALFLLTMAPYAILKDRLILRYSYVGHFGVAIVVAEGVRVAVTALRGRLPRLSAARGRRFC